MNMVEKLELSMDLYTKATQEGKSLTDILEEMDPTTEESGLDAFERQLKARGIYTKDAPELGISASKVGAFFLTDDNKVLFPELIRRTVRTAFDDFPLLQYIIGATTPVETDLVKTPYMDRPDKKDTRMRRISETAQLPKSKITLRDQAVRFFKYGRAIEASYETLRRMTIPMLSRYIGFIGRDAAQDKAEEGIYTLVKGDGNDNAAPVIKLSELDANASGKLTPEAFLRFCMLFNIFPCDTIVATKEAFVQVVLTQFPNLTAQQVLSLMVNGNLNSVRLSTPQMPQMSQTLLWTEDIIDPRGNAVFTGKKLLGFNRAAGLEQLVERGSTIQEAQRFILNQTQALTITENSGFSKMFKEAAYVLDLEQ